MKTSIFEKKIVLNAVKDSFFKLNPKSLMKNPVMFITMIGAVIVTMELFYVNSNSVSFVAQIALWLWFTVLFANFSEALAEGRGKAQADSLRKVRTTTIAKLRQGKEFKSVNAGSLKKDDVVECVAGDIIPGDGEVIEGAAMVDESAITGESAPVLRESGGDRSAVTGGTRVLSDRIVIKITAEPGKSFLDRMIHLIEGAKRQKTPNEIALSILLCGLTIIFVLAVSTLKFFADYSASASQQDLTGIVTVPVLIALLVCLIPTTIGGLLSAIGISGMDRLIQKNVIAISGRAVEAAGDVDVLLLDKTGTITLGNRMASEFIPAPGVKAEYLAKLSQMASMGDETPEGRSIIILAADKFKISGSHLDTNKLKIIPFSAHTRMSGVDIMENGVAKIIRKGAKARRKRWGTSATGSAKHD